MTLINKLINNMPAPLVAIIKYFKRRYKNLKYKFARLSDSSVIYTQDIVTSLRRVGIKEGDGVMVHSSMSKFGKIDGGPQTVIESIHEVVGDSGLIVMPAYPLTTKMKNHLDQGMTFDIVSTPSKMGAITEYFRKLPNVYRSLHPTHSVCARGKGAKELVAGHESCYTPFRAGSPFDKIVNKNLYLLLFGVDFGPVTIYHVFEDRLGHKFPFKVYLDKVYNARCIRDDGTEIIVKTLAHDPELSDIRIDNVKNKADQFYNLLNKSLLVREAVLGKGRIMVIKTGELLSEMEKLLKVGITIYERSLNK